MRYGQGMTRLISLNDALAMDADVVGAKAASLARLHRERVPVQPGIIVPVGAFHEFLRANHWLARAQSLDESLAEDIVRARMDPALADDLRREVGLLGECVAVRSSAVCEDGRDASWAGQLETVLGVRAGDDVEQAVLRCWASGFRSRARAYGDRKGEGVPPQMAVLIQPMLEPRCAGVMFTINPLSGSWREMTVEAAWGQAAPVVNGEVVPDAYCVRRPRRISRRLQRVLARAHLEVVGDEVRSQKEMWVTGESGLRTVPVPTALVDAPKLPHKALARLCRLGLRIEGLMGGPQDIEWAMTSERGFVILQTRPVTSAGHVQRAGPALWTRRFIGERWTEPATPLGWSLMGGLLSEFIGYPETQIRHLGGGEAVRMVRFAPYLNVTAFRHLAFKLPGAPPPQFMMELLPQAEQRGWRQRHAQMPDIRAYLSFLTETASGRRWRSFEPGLWSNPQRWEQFKEALDDELTRLCEIAETPAEALTMSHRCRSLAKRYVGIHVCSLLWANLLYQVAESALVASGRSNIVGHALRPQEESWTVKTNHALWRLGRGEIGMETFSDRFGHRAGSSWELFSPRWRDNPDVVKVLALAAAQHEDPARMAAQQAERAQEARLALGGWLGPLVEHTQRYLLLRENQRFHFDRLLDVWVRQLRRIEDLTGLSIRFLEAPELDALVAGELSQEVAAARIAERSVAWRSEVERRAKGDEPPVFLVGSEVMATESGSRRLQGTGTSPGVVTGRVRVLRSVEDGRYLVPGEILVARATDPGWTPLFLKAGGVIMELGGMLSHGAVVAREYGLPAVVNIEGATRRLEDGQVVTIDGQHGVVWLKSGDRSDA